MYFVFGLVFLSELLRFEAEVICLLLEELIKRKLVEWRNSGVWDFSLTPLFCWGWFTLASIRVVLFPTTLLVQAMQEFH